MADSTPKGLAVASSYADHERYFISSGKQLRFQNIPTPTYRLAQTTESLKTKGTFWQLNPSASSDAATTAVTWDVYTNLPLFAARYDSPLVSGNDSKTIYWEFEITSLGYSDAPASLAFGFVVKDAGSETVAARPEKSLRPYDAAAGLGPVSLSGPSLLWYSVDGGVYANGRKVEGADAHVAQVGDTIGLGVTFLFDASVSMVPTRDVLDSSATKPSKVSKAIDRRGNQTTRVADANDLVACPTKAFVTVNGVERESSGWDAVAREFLSGTTDVYPVLVVSGPGVGGKVRIGEAVQFGGEGGVQDAALAAKGNTAHAGFKKSKWSKVFKTAGGGGWFGGGQAGGFM
ncbi:hypothetical protein DRE_04821 [Drechslerella stenobrocha 248]|uniref:SPRY domain-containing protein n=1 Tax=Drechslerella stenobrocha 248 TaxID=1043628 RepID=W7I1D9_9PEZI|nr:hypothetical protein DRE_04821 [Drechslerella stenobrocha 248]